MFKDLRYAFFNTWFFLVFVIANICLTTLDTNFVWRQKKTKMAVV